MAEIAVRPATMDDAATIVGLANRFDAEDGGHQPFTADRVRRFGFGPQRLFTVLLAESAGHAIGYAMVCDVFDSERAAPGLWLQDLYVCPSTRQAGIGRRLMAAVAGAAVTRGAESIRWGVRNRNRQAIGFYLAIGAVDDDARILEIKGEDVAALAATA